MNDFFVCNRIEHFRRIARPAHDLVRARAEGQVSRAKLPIILGAGAIAFGFAAVIAVVLTMVLALATLLGPLGGGLLATLIALVIAGGLGFAALKSWQAGA